MSEMTMRAVVFKEPKKVALEERPMPRIENTTDIVVKVKYTALCGSELHVYRGHQESVPGFIMGHEFTGYVHQVGPAVSRGCSLVARCLTDLRQSIDRLKLCLMADIFPTGYFAAHNAFSSLDPIRIRESTVVLIGCGSIFPEALQSLKRTQHLLDFMTAKVMPLSQALAGYTLFDSMKVQKVIFEVE